MDGFSRSSDSVDLKTDSPTIDGEVCRGRLACEAAYLLNESIRQLQAPLLVLRWMEQVKPDFLSAGAVRNILISSTILHLRRLKETRDHFLVRWLFTEAELEALGFSRLEEFIGGKDKWAALETLRHQFAGHATRHTPHKKTPGQLIPGFVFGKGLRETGVFDLEPFLKKIQDNLLDGVVRVRDELNRRFPEVEKFIKEDYPLEVEKGRLGR